MNALPVVVVGVPDEEILLGGPINFHGWLILILGILGWLVLENGCLLIAILLGHGDIQRLYPFMAIIAIGVWAGIRVVWLAVVGTIVATTFIIGIAIAAHVPIIVPIIIIHCPTAAP